MLLTLLKIKVMQRNQHKLRFVSICLTLCLASSLISASEENISSALPLPGISLNSNYDDLVPLLDMLPLVLVGIEDSTPRTFATNSASNNSLDGALLIFSDKNRLTAIIGICREAKKATPELRKLSSSFKAAPRRLTRMTLVGKDSRRSIGYAMEDGKQLLVLELIPASPGAGEVESLTITRTLPKTDLSALGWESLPEDKKIAADKLLKFMESTSTKK